MPGTPGLSYRVTMISPDDSWVKNIVWHTDEDPVSNIVKPKDPFTSLSSLLREDVVKRFPAYLLPGIKSVIFNEEKGFTTILWNDDTSTVVHCGEGEKFERYEGFVMAVAKKLFGSTSAAKKIMDDNDVQLQKDMKILREEEAARAQQALEAEAHQKRVQREAARIVRDKKFMEEVRKELKETYGEQL